jgi:hypothetical protein
MLGWFAEVSEYLTGISLSVTLNVETTRFSQISADHLCKVSSTQKESKVNYKLNESFSRCAAFNIN